MFQGCRLERKLWASATVKRADPMLSRTSSENPSDPSLRAASEKNSSSAYNLEIVTKYDFLFTGLRTVTVYLCSRVTADWSPAKK